jgi:hypothetical protein
MQERINCAEFESLALLYAAGELNAEERGAVETHASECRTCNAALADALRFQTEIASRTPPAEQLDPSGLVLAQFRSELAEKLDEIAGPAAKPGWREWLAPARWAAEVRHSLAFRPGWSVAALLLVGALGGTLVRAWYRQTSLPLPGKPMMTVSAAPRMSDQELASMGVEGIRWEPQSGEGAPRVEVQVRTERPVVVQGSADDAEVRRVLTYVVEHGQRFDPSVRLDSLDVLRTRTADAKVRAAICQAAQRDDNPAVRLKALEALQGLGGDPDVRAAMLAVLAGDDNSGLRVEAVNGLLDALGQDDLPAVPFGNGALDILRDRMRNDPNQYVRQRSAAALGQLASFDGGSLSGSPRGPRP